MMRADEKSNFQLASPDEYRGEQASDDQTKTLYVKTLSALNRNSNDLGLNVRVQGSSIDHISREISRRTQRQLSRQYLLGQAAREAQVHLLAFIAADMYFPYVHSPKRLVAESKNILHAHLSHAEQGHTPSLHHVK